MTKKMGIREIIRNFSVIDRYDYIEVEDKKTHKIKGIFISGKYLDEIREIVKKIIEEKKKKEIEEILKFAGIANGEFGEKTFQELKAEKRKKYYNE